MCMTNMVTSGGGESKYEITHKRDICDRLNKIW